MPRRKSVPVPKKLADGVWTLRWRARHGDTETRHRRTFRTQAEANAFIRDEWAANPHRDWRAAETPFTAYADAWLDTVRPSIKAKTYEGYAQSLKHARNYFQGEPVGEITPRRAREFIAHLIATPTLKSSRSIRTTFRVFSAVMALAVEDQAITVNPAAVVASKLPRPSTHRNAEGNVVPTFSAHPPTAAQVAKVVARLDADGREPYGLMVEFLFNTGLRAGELAGLEIRDLTLWVGRGGWRGSVKVERTKRKVKRSDEHPDGWAEDTPKSKRSVRKVPLPSHVAEAMHEYMTTHPHADDPNAPLWPNRVRGGGERDAVTGRLVAGSRHALDWSEPVEPRAFYRNVYLATLAAIGLPKSRLHDLRHAFARTYLAAGGDIHRLSETMGHGSYRITYDVYAEWIPCEDDAPHPLDSRRAAGA